MIKAIRRPLLWVSMLYVVSCSLNNKLPSSEVSSPQVSPLTSVDFSLHEAASKGDLAVVESLLQSGANIQAKTDNGWTPIHYAAREGHVDVVTFLLERGATIQAKTDNGWTPLHSAARWGRTEVVGVLVKAGGSIQAKDTNGWTPLHGAAAQGQVDVVACLLKSGAGIQDKTDNGWTPLHLAVCDGHTELVAWLLEAKADMHAKNKDEKTPLQIAALNGHTDVVALLKSWDLGRGQPLDSFKNVMAPCLSLIDTTLEKRNIEIGTRTKHVDNLAIRGHISTDVCPREILPEPLIQETPQNVYSFINPPESPIQATPQHTYGVMSQLETRPQAIGNSERGVSNKECELVYGSDTEAIDPNNAIFDSFIGVNRIAMGMLTLEKEPLAGGAFGQVYRGSWGHRPIALKKIDFEYAQKNLGLDKDDVLEALGWEIARSSTVSHPNLVQFYGIYQHKREGYTYLVMEFCEGGELRKQLKKEGGNIPWSKRWQWALESAEGLAYLHHEGVLHRDLKAENILLDRNGRAKLADLGVAQVDALLEKEEATVVAIGLQDKRFIAPENIGNEQFSSQETDIYALGLVLWEIASGKKPRRLEELPYLKTWAAGNHIEREPIPIDCPESFQELIRACWQKEPKKRPSAAKLVGSLKELGAEFNPRHHVLIQACGELENIIHPKRQEGLAYMAPFVTALEVEEPIENYWATWEDPQETNKGFNPPVSLADTFRNFMQTPGRSTLLLLGEAGLGKTLTTYMWADEVMKGWWAHIQDPAVKAPDYFPVFIRPTVAGWTHTALEGAFVNIVKRYGLQDIPLVVFIDGYDELHMNKAPDNLVKHLGLLDYPHVKLIVTCRPKTVDAEELAERFSFNGALQTCHFLPFSMDQSLGYLKEQLSWSEETQAAYKRTLESSKSVREVLRNPFVLYLLRQSWKTLSAEPLDELTRWKIYEGFVKHAITTQSRLLASELQDTLAVGYTDLVASFQVFARAVAFRSCQKHRMICSVQEAAQEINSPWVKLAALVAADAQKQFSKRQEQLSAASEAAKAHKQRRALLREEDFIGMMQRRKQRFEGDLPLKIRGEGYHFRHKSLFEYFVAKQLLAVMEKEADFISHEDLQSLVDELVASTPESLLFLYEGYSQATGKELTPPVECLQEAEVSGKTLENSAALFLDAIKALKNRALLLDAIGRVLSEKKANYAEARVYLGQALAIKEKVLGKEHPHVADSYNNIGAVLDNQGKSEEGLAYHLKALAIFEKVFGKEHPDVAGSYNNIGLVLQNQGKYEEGLAYFLKALAISEKVLGKEHPHVAASYNNIGVVLHEQGKYEEGLAYSLKALAIQEKVLGKEHPKVAVSYNNIGALLYNQGKYEEGLAYCLKALAIFEKVLGKEHPDVANSYNNIGGVLYTQGKYIEALEYFRKALTIQAEKLGKNHPDTKSCMSIINRLEKKILNKFRKVKK